MSFQSLVWSPLPNNNIVPVAPNITNPGFLHGVNNNIPIAYGSPQNYINIPNQQPYQRYTHIANGYPIASIPNTQNLSAVPVMVRPPYRPPINNSFATQQNIKLIQTAWNRTNGGVKKQKRIRTAFTSQQMMELEQEYARTRYLDRTRRIELADILRLNERTIKIWFQNRRMKEKKDRAESLEENDDVTTTQSPSDSGVPIFHEQYQANNEAYNRMGIFVEEYPVSSSSVQTSMAEPQMSGLSSYNGLPIPEEVLPPYEHLQATQFSSPYSEVHELSPESAPQSESSISVGTSAPSDVADRNWDLSWIKNIQSEEE